MSFLSKAIKKIGKVVKKAVPILNVVAGFTPLGGVAKLASGGLKTISKLKSSGTNIKRLAMGGQPPQAERAAVATVTQGGGLGASTSKPKKTPAKPKAKTATKAKPKTMTAKQTAVLKDLAARWKATGGSGTGTNEDGLTWTEYANLFRDLWGG